MRAEAHAWKFCGRDLDHLESYFVPIDFDQRYPDRRDVKYNDEHSTKYCKLTKKKFSEEEPDECK